MSDVHDLITGDIHTARAHVLAGLRATIGYVREYPGVDQSPLDFTETVDNLLSMILRRAEDLAELLNQAEQAASAAARGKIPPSAIVAPMQAAGGRFSLTSAALAYALGCASREGEAFDRTAKLTRLDRLLRPIHGEADDAASARPGGREAFSVTAADFGRLFEAWSSAGLGADGRGSHEEDEAWVRSALAALAIEPESDGGSDGTE